MNAETWLQLATADLPPAVARRVRAETLAHLEDLRAAGKSEALALAYLGSPRELNRELLGEYMGVTEWSRLEQNHAPWLSHPLVWLVFLTFLVGQVWATPTALGAMGLGFAVAVWVFSLRLSLLRAQPWQWTGLMFGLSWQWLGLAASRWMSGEPLVAVALVALVFAAAWKHLHRLLRQDARLRRTLEAERA